MASLEQRLSPPIAHRVDPRRHAASLPLGHPTQLLRPSFGHARTSPLQAASLERHPNYPGNSPQDYPERSPPQVTAAYRSHHTRDSHEKIFMPTKSKGTPDPISSPPWIRTRRDPFAIVPISLLAEEQCCQTPSFPRHQPAINVKVSLGGRARVRTIAPHCDSERGALPRYGLSRSFVSLPLRSLYRPSTCWIRSSTLRPVVIMSKPSMLKHTGPKSSVC